MKVDSACKENFGLFLYKLEPNIGQPVSRA